ncbi:helix-turn-helix domain-containing protein [Sutcliffiella cohnii]
MNLVPKIREIAKKKGIKHKFIAEKMDKTPQHFSKWVNGVGKKPDADELWKLAKILNCKVDDLYEVVEDEGIKDD